MFAALNTAVFAAPARIRSRARTACRASSEVPGYVNPLRPAESPQQAAERRAAETSRIRERTKTIKSLEDLQAAFSGGKADQLYILSVQSESDCYLGANPDGVPDGSKAERQMACVALQGALQRVARNSENVTFLEMIGDEDAAATAFSQELGVQNFPTIQYWKGGDLLWQTVGAAASGNALAESLLFYGSRDSKTGASVAGLVEEISTPGELGAFFEACSAPAETVLGVKIEVPCEKQIAVVNVSLGKSSAGCVNIYPAVVALAQTTAGAVRWARLLADASPTTKEMMKTMNVTTVPSFVFFVDGKEVGRYSGADRGQLMAAVLEIQNQVGYKLPEPPVRKRLGVAEAKKIAAAQRAQEKGQVGWTK